MLINTSLQTPDRKYFKAEPWDLVSLLLLTLEFLADGLVIPKYSGFDRLQELLLLSLLLVLPLLLLWPLILLLLLLQLLLLLLLLSLGMEGYSLPR